MGRDRPRRGGQRGRTVSGAGGSSLVALVRRLCRHRRRPDRYDPGAGTARASLRRLGAPRDGAPRRHPHAILGVLGWNPARSPHPAAAATGQARIERLRMTGQSLGPCGNAWAESAGVPRNSRSSPRSRHERQTDRVPTSLLDRRQGHARHAGPPIFVIFPCALHSVSTFRGYRRQRRWIRSWRTTGRRPKETDAS